MQESSHKVGGLMIISTTQTLVWTACCHESHCECMRGVVLCGVADLGQPWPSMRLKKQRGSNGEGEWNERERERRDERDESNVHRWRWFVAGACSPYHALSGFVDLCATDRDESVWV